MRKPLCERAATDCQRKESRRERWGKRTDFRCCRTKSNEQRRMRQGCTGKGPAACATALPDLVLPEEADPDGL